MKFDFTNLQERIAVKYATLAELAAAIDLSPTQLALRLDNRLQFFASEIVRIAEALEIPGDEIELYFFTPKFDEIELEGDLYEYRVSDQDFEDWKYYYHYSAASTLRR